MDKKYIVHGVKRRSSSLNTERVDHIYEINNKSFFLHYGDVTDAISIHKLINLIKPDEIYNLSAQSHVAVSFMIPSYTANVDALGCLNILEAIKTSNLTKRLNFIKRVPQKCLESIRDTTDRKDSILSKKPIWCC